MTNAISDRSPNTRFCFGERVRVTAGFYRGSTGTVVGIFDASNRRTFVVRLRRPWPWCWNMRGIYIYEADLEHER